MQTNLLIFGDSWAYGAELKESQREKLCFGAVLGRLLNIDQIFNFSEPGTGITHLNLQLDSAVKELGLKSPKKDQTFIAVFFLSGKERFLFFDSQGEYAHLAAAGSVIRPCQNHLINDFDMINEFYFKHLNSSKSDVINLNVNLACLQSRCLYHGIRDFYISGWQPLDLWCEIDRSKIYEQGNKTCADFLGLSNKDGQMIFKNNPFIFRYRTHPNQKGHAMIAQELYQMISPKLKTDPCLYHG